MPMSSSESATALKRTVIIAIFAAVAVVLSLIEAQIPLSGMGLVPGAKLGLANIMILTCIYFYVDGMLSCLSSSKHCLLHFC